MEPVNVIRAPSLKRGKIDEKLCDRIKLKRVFGLTVCSNAALDVSPTNGALAYPAGCTVVLFNLKKLTQSYLLNTSRKAITAVAYSQCGKYIATGECGLNPSIKVWELDLQNGNFESGSAGNVVAEFSGHKYAVNCVAFSPTGKYLVSVGSQHDMIVNVFEWKQNLKIASNKVSAKVVAVSFSEDGAYFVTVGNRHVKYWYLDGGRKYKEPQPIPLMGRSAILGELRNNDFCAVACGKGIIAESTYAITRNGHLVEFNSRRLLDKWVACRTTSANCICVSSKFILVGCAESIVRVFYAENLEYITTLPRTHYLGVDVSLGVHINHMMSTPPNAKYPDTIAIVYDEQRSKVSCVYNDHSLYIWDLKDIQRVGKSHSFLYHSACIWGVETVPYNYIKNNLSFNLPLDCFLTCSSDDTIRVWGLDGCENTDVYRKNIYSKDLLKVMYIDKEMNFIKDMDNPILNNEKTSSYDGRNGVRCIKINPENSHLATGDRSGNVRIYDLINSKLITTIEAHDSEVLCLEYTNEKIIKKLLASASRDRLVHVFDVQNGYKILQTLDDHSSSITSVKFIGSGMTFQMISCGADKSIIFRNYQGNTFLRGNNCSGKNTLYDMEIDSNSKHILTACQDRNIRVYGTQNAKHTKTFKGSHADEGSLIKLSLDLSGIYIATSCTDKTLSVYDYYSNECMARMYGHSELVTGLKFTNDCKHLISASGDGCIFVWQVPHDMVVTMQARLSQQALRSGQQPTIPRPISQSAEIIGEFGSPPGNNVFMDDLPVSPGYKFSDVGQLPQWAKRKTSEDNTALSPVLLGSSPSQISAFGNNPKPRGRWAQKSQFEPDALDLRNTIESPNFNNSNISTNNLNNNSSDYHSASSKDVYNNLYLSEDSSIDSGVENRFRSKNIIEQKNLNSLNSESNTEHDGDVEDMSDGERTSSDHGLLFYPSVGPGTPTDFKVNEMNVDELRKSMRKQKLEKQGLTITNILLQSAHSTGTGTGTSDDEDEGSTPSGDNAERSLASTLGGSSESIPQQSFLQVALDGLGTTTDKDRGRKSLSTIHNSDSKIIPNNSLSKSFSNSKKEELMKVINEAKQKLENGLIMQKHREVKKLKTICEVGYRSNLRASQSISDLSHSANLEANYRATRGQRQGDFILNTKPTSASNFLHCAASKSVLSQNCNIIRQLQRDYPPFPKDVGNYSIDKRPNTLEIPILSVDGTNQDKIKLKKHPGILKHYKSCPVSPVHEEIEFSTLNVDNLNNLQNDSNKRHSMYTENARSIFDMIHEDTEKMIAEITNKYGDLDDFEPKKEPIDTKKKIVNKHLNNAKYTAQKEKDEHGFLSEEDGNFSSDSLEDCSLNLEINNKKTLCKKHSKTDEQLKMPKRSVSDYFIYEEFYTNRYRKVSLSEILNEDEDKENNFLETQRHSSASFFLGHDNKSQESIISDEYSCGVSYCNSMESILSDESECKSAPLEILFGRTKKEINRYTFTNDYKNENSSKSYGSSPNATNGFDYYMQNQDEFHDMSMYTFDNLYKNKRLPTSSTFPRNKEDEFIPSLSSKKSQYNSGVNKSLSKEFANQRLHNNSNPLLSCDEDDENFFVRKNIPSIKRADIFTENSLVKKSCSFEIELNTGSPQRAIKRFEQNLEKFERERKTARQTQFGGTLEMNYVPHKPPVAGRRSSSMRSKNRPKTKEKFNSNLKTDSTKVRDFVNTNLGFKSEERTFDLYCMEKAIEYDNMDSLEMYIKKDLNKESSMDSLDMVDLKLSNTMEYSKFLDIEKKIEIINKLVEMEETKLRLEKITKEHRMKPFNCDLSQKGYVKSLTMNFDNMAKAAQEKYELEQNRSPARIKRNYSLPDVLEGAKMKSFDFSDEDIFKSDNENHSFDNNLSYNEGSHAKSLISAHDDDSSIRRACSLSDLSMGKGYKTVSTPNGKTIPSNRTSIPTRNQVKRSSSTKLSVSGMGMRSVSVGMLNQASDSETDTLNLRGGLLRPTISSQNKSNGSTSSRPYSNSKNSIGIINRRRGLQNAHSTVNLSTTGQDDSSSEETPSIVNSGKPIVPPRPRSISVDHKRFSNLSINSKSRNSSYEISPMDLPCKDTDVANADLTSQLCSNIISQLMQTTNSVMQLHNRLKFSDEPSESRNNNMMLKELENAVIMTQNMLTKTIRSNNENQNVTGSSSRENRNSPENGEYLQMMNKCSDILSKVQNQVNN